MINLQLWKAKKKELHLNYEQIAAKAGVSKRTIEDIFRGYTTDPRVETVQRIEYALMLRQPNWTDEERVQGVGQHPITLSAEEWDWLELRSELIRTMGEDYQKTVKKMLEELVKKNN